MTVDMTWEERLAAIDAAKAAELLEVQRFAEKLAFAEQEEYLRLRAREAATRRREREVAEETRAAAADSVHVYDGGAFLLDVPAVPPAIWGSGDEILWARGEALMVAGPQGVGKTTLAGQLLRGSVGLPGDGVLGYPVEPSDGRTLYLAMDRPAQAQRALGRLFDPTEREVLADRLRVWAGPPPADFAAAPETLMEMALQHKATRVFVDSLKDAAVGLSKDEVGAGYNRARQMALAEGIDVVELHHMVKNAVDGRAPKRATDVYGSVWLTSGAGSIILLWGEPGDPLVEFVHLKQPMTEVGPFKVSHDHTAGTSSVFYEEETDVLALARRCASTGITALEAAAAIFETEKPTKVEKEKARRKLLALTESGGLVHYALGHEKALNADRWYPAAPSAWTDVDETRPEWYR